MLVFLGVGRRKCKENGSKRGDGHEVDVVGGIGIVAIFVIAAVVIIAFIVCVIHLDRSTFALLVGGIVGMLLACGAKVGWMPNFTTLSAFIYFEAIGRRVICLIAMLARCGMLSG